MSGFITDNNSNSVLGGGKKGMQPLGGFYQSSRYGNERATDRNILIKAFGNKYNNGLGKSPLIMSNESKSKCGRFRAAFNAGDIIGTTNEQTDKKYGKEHNSIYINHVNGGSLKQNGSAFYAGNPKYVYDSSDFIKYKKLQALNKNYNDKSSGGDNNRASQSVKLRLKM